ncbi:MAG: alpha-ribazole phosphatase family protein, partial [Bacteroidaceae bacterium]|nr:alpha-ribazole phosphatase family protein [Bacteroidaceae bacterium]
MNTYFIRHTSVDVAPGVCYGRSDVPLSDTFEEEASRTLEQIKDIKFDKVYTSPLSRSVKLATYCGFPKAEQEPRIMELDFGDWEMQKFDDIKDHNLEKWYKDFLDIKPAGGESYQDMAARVASFKTELR